jgi:hypothetical protein
MHRRVIPAFFAIALTAMPFSATLTAPGFAADQQANQRVRVRGKIAALNGQTLTVKTREGGTADITLGDSFAVSGVVKAAITDIKPGDFVGIASLPKADGGNGALEVLIFPAAMKGTGEGSYGWDLQPNSTMTNATVANAVKGVEGHTVTLTYKGGEKKITIPEGVPIVTFTPATVADLKPGLQVFVPGEKTPAGVISSRRVVVEMNGVVPPM